MAFESVRGYVQLASGLGELTRARALEAAQGLLSLPAVASTGRVAGQVTSLADELLAAATTNRENLTALVRSEVESALSRMGLVPAAELEVAQAQVTRLSAELAHLRTSGSAGSGQEAGEEATQRASRPDPASRTSAGAAPAAVPSSRPARKKATTAAPAATGKRASRKKATASKLPETATTETATTAKATTAKATTAKATTAKATTAKKAADGRPTGKRAAAKKAAAKKGAAKKAAGTSARKLAARKAAPSAPSGAVTTRRPRKETS